MRTNERPAALAIRELFTGRDFRVPLYQRAYAWTSAEVHTLLEDVRQARQAQDAGRVSSDYYIGSLVVDVRRENGSTVDEVVDGQQRLTTLCILLAVAPAILGTTFATGRLSRLSYEGRPEAQQDLQELVTHGEAAIDRLQVPAISSAAMLIQEAAVRGTSPGTDILSNEPIFDADDLQFLLDHVRILRTQLPEGTDLNHYFEVMNTRGQQLEKHEILKARLMEPLPPDDYAVFSKVWDACTVLDRHVQLQFTTAERTAVFGADWNHIVPTHFDALKAALEPVTGSTEQGPSAVVVQSLAELVATVESGQLPAQRTAQTDAEDDSGTFGVITDFPNLLLHVLRILVVTDAQHVGRSTKISWNSRHEVEDDAVVRLEDRHLLHEFDTFRREPDGTPLSTREQKAQWSRRFIHLLLRVRLLLDNYVIRTAPTSDGRAEEENWVLRTAYKYESPYLGRNKRTQLSASETFQDLRLDTARNLEAMFQVTDTRRTSKYFLYRLLLWLSSQTSEIRADALIAELKRLGGERLHAYDDLDGSLDKGVQVPNFVFNALDFLLWNVHMNPDDSLASRTREFLDKTTELPALEKSAELFHFRYRTSVEHFYPVHPSEGQGHRTLNPDDVNKFGNLCIMSRGENSRRNNLMPTAKAAEFTAREQSLKFQLMAALTEKHHRWEENQIKDHGNRMREVLKTWVKHHRPESDT
ncbi:MAG: DUF262 domain-containing HNH endonuclease family protein [Brachybacterium sp.]|nr:DUF262 domain-containing HNH endonuclease family protein [Brachybacterium sp.]